MCDFQLPQERHSSAVMLKPFMNLFLMKAWWFFSYGFESGSIMHGSKNFLSFPFYLLSSLFLSVAGCIFLLISLFPSISLSSYLPVSCVYAHTSIFLWWWWWYVLLTTGNLTSPGSKVKKWNASLQSFPHVLTSLSLSQL